MHIYKNPKTMQKKPLSTKEALSSVGSFFTETFQRLKNLDFPEDKIWFDPGIGFGKDIGANLLLMKQVKEYSKHYNILMGTSRKSWIGKFFGIEKPKDRDQISKITELMLSFLGAKMIRTHEVKELAKLRELVQ